jgi:hypothetical protein
MTEDEFLDYARRQDIRCGLGWYGIIVSVLMDTARFNGDHPDGQVLIGSFESWRGTLHVTVPEGCPDSLKRTFDAAREASAGICEHCGRNGKLRRCDDGTEKTLCRECRGKHGKRGRRKKPGGTPYDCMRDQAIRCGFRWHVLVSPLAAKIGEWDERRRGKCQLDGDTCGPNWAPLRITTEGGFHCLCWHGEEAEGAHGRACANCRGPGVRVDICGRLEMRCPGCADGTKNLQA